MVIIYTYLYKVCIAYSGSWENAYECVRVTCHQTVGLRNAGLREEYILTFTSRSSPDIRVPLPWYVLFFQMLCWCRYSGWTPTVRDRWHAEGTACGLRVGATCAAGSASVCLYCALPHASAPSNALDKCTVKTSIMTPTSSQKIVSQKKEGALASPTLIDGQHRFKSVYWFFGPSLWSGTVSRPPGW